MATTGVLWPSLYQGDGTRIRKWLYGSVLIRDWDPAGSTNMANIQVFAANGNLNPLLLVPVAAGGYGFYDVGSITENGVEFTPQFTVDETYIWQSRKSQRTDITKDDEEIMFSAAESTPLIDYLWYNLEIGFTGVPLFPSIGSPNYEIVKPFFSDVIYRQLLIIGVDGSMGTNGQPEYKIELRPRVSLAKKAKRQWAAKQIDVTDLTFTTHVDPYSGFDAATLRGGTVWTDEGGTPTFAAPNYISLAPPAANTAAIVPSTLAAAAPGGSGGTWSPTGNYYWKMTAVTAAGESTTSNEVTQNITTSTYSVVLTWTQVTGATGYKIYRGTSTGGENILVTTIGSGSTVTYTDTGSAGTSATPPVVNTAAIAAPSGLGVTGSGTGGVLPAGTDYWVITGLTAQGETTKSNEVNANLTGTTSSAALSWTADTGAIGYRIYRGISGAGSEAYLAGYVNLGATTSFTDIGSSVNASALPSHQVQLQWQQPSNLLQTFSYTITQTTGGSTTATTVVTAPSANATGLVTAVVGSLTTSNVYTFTVTVALANGSTASYPVSNAVTST
jgi:hypothetical protein